MSTSIDQAFIKQYEAEVKEAYQRTGSKLRSLVRNKTNVVGQSTTFQKVGKGTADTKSRHGLVPVMNMAHSSVECLLADYYAGDWVDKLDELKTNIDERSIVANGGAYALGRKTDDLIFSALGSVSAGQKIAVAASGLTIGKVYSAFEKLGNADVPDDGQRYAIVGLRQWTDLMQLKEFSSADYVSDAMLPFKGMQAKSWMGTTWMAYSGQAANATASTSGLPIDASNVRKCYWFHKTAIGHASGAEVTTDITWHGDRASHFVNNMMSQGAVLIDETGIIEIACQE